MITKILVCEHRFFLNFSHFESYKVFHLLEGLLSFGKAWFIFGNAEFF